MGAAHHWNCCAFAIDKVSYGEWQIKEIGPNNCTFELTDPRLEFARIIGLRREAVQRIHHLKGMQPHSGLYIGQKLQKILPHFLEASLGYFSAKCGFTLQLPRYWELRKRLERRLTDLRSSADLLLLAAGEEGSGAFHDYMACAAVRWFHEVCQEAKMHVAKRKQRVGETSLVRRSDLVNFLALDEESSAGVACAIERLCKYPPRESFHSLLDHPAILLRNDSIMFITALDAGLWPASIRSTWTRQGPIGDRYGKIWEEYICWLVNRSGWAVLKKNVTLRQGKRCLTDIDLLITRDNVCLILQLKALAGAGVNTYQHWKNRQTIEKGVLQARRAADLLMSTPGRFASIVGGRAAALTDTFCPVVLTTLHYFNGWKKDGVAVISVSALENLMRGATVTFRDSKGQTAEETSHSSASEVSGKEFLEFLDRPLDWRISSGDGSVSEHSFEFEGTNWTVPFVGAESFRLELHPDS